MDSYPVCPSGTLLSVSLTVEDSQGNIYPYAVTGFPVKSTERTEQGTTRRENQYHRDGVDSAGMHSSLSACERKFGFLIDSSASERYFRPIPLQCSLPVPHNPDLPKHAYRPPSSKLSNNDQNSSSADSGVHSASTLSPPYHRHHCLLDCVSSVNHDGAPYGTYDQQIAQFRSVARRCSARCDEGESLGRSSRMTDTANHLHRSRSPWCEPNEQSSVRDSFSILSNSLYCETNDTS